jgi:hypothetical protein
MEQKELIGLKQMEDIQPIAQKNGKSIEDCLPLEAIKVVINSKNYRIEIEIS